MNAFILLDVLGDFFGDSVMVSENLANYFLHDVGFLGVHSSDLRKRMNAEYFD